MLLFHEKDFGGARELTCLRYSHVITVPPAEERSTSKYSFIHGIWHLLLESKALTLWAGSDKASHVKEASGPVMASSLKLSNRFVTSVVSAESSVASFDEVNVLGCDGECAARDRWFCMLTCDCRWAD